ncbi:membrane-associating domain-containing protein [Aspergillus heterothallicus]
MAAKRTLEPTLRALQLIFSIIIMGTDGYAIHAFHGYTDYVRADFGNFYAHVGVPNAWGFLMFCAGWTFLGVIFLLIVSRTNLVDKHAWAGYICFAVEAVALLSWVAGFIAVAVNTGSSDACLTTGSKICRLLTAATVFGALEWVLFVGTAALRFKGVFGDVHRRRAQTKEETSTAGVDIST